jgi:hypothetical protein
MSKKLETLIWDTEGLKMENAGVLEECRFFHNAIRMMSFNDLILYLIALQHQQKSFSKNNDKGLPRIEA